jgi:hypothetical protein
MRKRIDDGLTAEQRWNLRHPEGKHEYYLRNKERIKVNSRKFRLEHPDYTKHYCETHKEQIKESNRKYRLAHPIPKKPKKVRIPKPEIPKPEIIPKFKPRSTYELELEKKEAGKPKPKERPKGIPKMKICKYCGKEFPADPSHSKKKFCNRTCCQLWVKANSKSKVPHEYRKHRIKVFPPRVLPSIDSIIDVPCFGCPIQPCIPQTCQKLTEYLIEQVEFDKIKEKAERDRLKAKVEMEKLTILD